MSPQMTKGTRLFNRATGLLVIEVRHSNPNGDPDAESDPRTIDADGHGLISPVSFKRKLRDLIDSKEGPAWIAASSALDLSNSDKRFRILEQRGRDRDEIFSMKSEEFKNAFWDARVFGNTFLEDMKDKGYEKGEKDHFISTGVVQFGPGESISPVDVERLTTTNKSGVQEGKDRGMAPLGWRVVRHGVYALPFFVNPMMAVKSGCSEEDIRLLQFMVPHVYRNTASATRPFVEVRHAWYAEHTSPLGSCPDSIILDALKPKRIAGDPNSPSASIAEYEIPTKLEKVILDRLESFEDLCAKAWK